MHHSLINDAETPVLQADVLVSAIEQLHPVVFILGAVADFVDDDGFVLDDDRHRGRAIRRQFTLLIFICIRRFIRGWASTRRAAAARRPGAFTFAIPRAHLHKIGFLCGQPR